MRKSGPHLWGELSFFYSSALLMLYAEAGNQTDYHRQHSGNAAPQCQLSAAAAKAAAVMLLTGRRLETVALLTPKGIRLELEVREVETGPGYVSCAIAKDAGDDPDVTDGALIFPVVPRMEMPPAMPRRGLKVFFARRSPWTSAGSWAFPGPCWWAMWESW
mgnify:CR=1 FL=1